MRQSDVGRRFGTTAWPHPTQANLDWCASADRFDFAMPTQRTRDGVIVPPVPAPVAAIESGAGCGALA